MMDYVTMLIWQLALVYIFMNPVSLLFLYVILIWFVITIIKIVKVSQLIPVKTPNF